MSVTLNSTTITLNSGAVVQPPDGTAPCYLPRAWLNFSSWSVNGGSQGGTYQIYGSANISSIGIASFAGEVAINFATAMPNAQYTAVEMGSTINGAGAYEGASCCESLTISGGVPVRKSTASTFYIITLGGGYDARYTGSMGLAFYG